MTTKEEKEAVNLSVNRQIKRLFKAQCAMIGREMSEVTEELYETFLKSQGVAVAEEPKKKRR